MHIGSHLFNRCGHRNTVAATRHYVCNPERYTEAPTGKVKTPCQAPIRLCGS